MAFEKDGGESPPGTNRGSGPDDGKFDRAGERRVQGFCPRRSLGDRLYAPGCGAGLLVNSTEGMVCAGAVVEETALEPGELLLFSQGGARIYLKNSGEVVINGQVFAAEEGE